MTTYLCISIGDDPATALPVLATTDYVVIAGTITAILAKVADDAKATRKRAAEDN